MTAMTEGHVADHMTAGERDQWADRHAGAVIDAMSAAQCRRMLRVLTAWTSEAPERREAWDEAHWTATTD